MSFDRIEFNDDLIVWRPNEIEGDAACPLGPPLPALAMVSGTTCDGTRFLPTLASGSTAARTPERSYTLSLPLPQEGPYLLALSSTAPDMSMLLCDTPCGPTARCHAIGSAGKPMVIPTGLPAGQYALVVKAIGAAGDACGDYSVSMFGPLD